MEIIYFLEKDEELKSEPISTTENFTSLSLAKRFNRYCVYLENNQEIFNGNTDFLMQLENNKMCYIHINYEKQKFEKFNDIEESAEYAAIAACIRPHRTGKQTIELLKKLTKEKIDKIILHFFPKRVELKGGLKSDDYSSIPPFGCGWKSNQISSQTTEEDKTNLNYSLQNTENKTNLQTNLQKEEDKTNLQTNLQKEDKTNLNSSLQIKRCFGRKLANLL